LLLLPGLGSPKAALLNAGAWGRCPEGLWAL
jgi:hypothetical protein